MTSKSRPDTKPGCDECRHSQQHRPAFVRTAALVCTHPSALKLNRGAVWFHTIAREVCKGRRFEHRSK
jgi:hypothetical protein